MTRVTKSRGAGRRVVAMGYYSNSHSAEKPAEGAWKKCCEHCAFKKKGPHSSGGLGRISRDMYGAFVGAPFDCIHRHADGTPAPDVFADLVPIEELKGPYFRCAAWEALFGGD